MTQRMHSLVVQPMFIPSMAHENGSIIYQKLRSFRHLRQGWHYGQGAAPTDRVIRRCQDIVRYAYKRGFHKFDAFPGIGGEVLTTIYKENKTLEFTVEPDLSVEFVLEVDDDIIEERAGFDFEQVKSTIDLNCSEQWRLYVSSIRNTMIKRDRDLLVWRSNDTDPVSLYSTPNVPFSAAVTSVPILESTTTQSTASLYSSGESKKVRFLSDTRS